MDTWCYEFYLVPTRSVVPSLLASGTNFRKDNVSTDQGKEDGFRIIQVPYIYCALYFYYYYICSTSDYQVLDPGIWELLYQMIRSLLAMFQEYQLNNNLI